MIVPPQQPSTESSDAVSAVWIDAVLPHLDKCDKIIKPEAARTAFHFINVSNTAPLGQKPNAAQLATLRDKTAATHVVFLRYKTDRRSLAVRATIFRLRPTWQLARRQTLIKQLLARHERRLEKGNPLRSADANVRAVFAGLIPNAITFGAGNSTLINDRVFSGEIAELEAHRRATVPQAIQGLGVANVSHRDGYRLFDVDWDLSGSVRFLTDNPTVVYQFKDEARRETKDETFDYTFSFVSLAGLVTIEGFVYWPLGATFGGLGVGVAPYRFQDSAGRSITSLDALVRFEMGHRVFLSDRWYLEFSFDQITFTRGIVDSDLFKAYTMTSGWLGFGWFFPRSGWLE